MMFDELDREMWLAKRLKEHGTHVFDGVTDRAERKARFREAINDVGALVVVGRSKAGHAMSYADVFRELYGEPL